MPAFSAFTIVDWGCVCVCVLSSLFAGRVCGAMSHHRISLNIIQSYHRPNEFPTTKRNFFFFLFTDSATGKFYDFSARKLVPYGLWYINISLMSPNTNVFSSSPLSLRLVFHVFVLVHRMPLSLLHNSSVSVAIEPHNVQKTHSTSYDTIISCGQKTSSTINDINIMPSLLVAVSIYLFAYYYLHYLAPANGEGQLYCLFAIWL